MKIQAKDIKTGMTITRGHGTFTVNSITKGFQKNGTPTVILTGVSESNKRRIDGTISKPFTTKEIYKELTFLNIK